MPTVKETETVVRSLGLPVGHYAICGGAMLAKRGLRENVSDVDLLVTPRLYAKLLQIWPTSKKGSQGGTKTPTRVFLSESSPDGIKVEAFCSINFSDFAKALEYLSRTEIIDGLPYVCLADMLEWKESYAFALPEENPTKSKHLADVVVMRKALGLNTPKYSWNFSLFAA